MLAKRVTRFQDANERLAEELAALREVNSEIRKKALSLAKANRKLMSDARRLERLALYDSQTGLGNRDLFLRQVEFLIAIAERKKEEVALLVMDLDGFKAINDRLGHAAGDEVLREIGVRLATTLRRADQKFRIGGDEFAVLLEPGARAFDGALVVAEQLAKHLAAPIEIKGGMHSIGVSIGIAVFPEHGRESSALLRKADAAMYEAKKKRLVVAGASDLGATTILESLQTNLFQLIYVSTESRPMSNGDLMNLLLQASIRNAHSQLTGMLLYKQGRFMGVLEGEEARVRSVFARIETDGRHKNLDTLRSGSIECRNFPGWTMSFENLDPASIPSYTRFLEQNVMPEYFAEETVESHAMLLAFKRASFADPSGTVAIRQLREDH